MNRHDHDRKTTRTKRQAVFSFLALILTASAFGCASTIPHRHELDRFGYVFFLDGAGGANALRDYSQCVAAWLRNANFAGEFYSFPWHTGLGVAADQASSVEYKRRKGAELARMIYKYMDEHPGTPVSLIGLSAGTAVAIYALEELPSRYRVDSVVLLGSSMSAHYDLTKALQRLEGELTVFTSQKDAVLGVLVPLAGTADRMFCGACTAGLHGFHLPEGADDRTRGLYSRKVRNIRWDPEFAAAAANYGGHTDAVNEKFIRDYVAPLIVLEGPSFADAGLPPRY